jgi:hypothetical protein
MTLVFALLQKDFLLFASDRRHTRGDHSANYRHDCDTKVHEIMHGKGLFGFAGDDLCEQIFYRAKEQKVFEGDDLWLVANGLSELARREYGIALPGVVEEKPPVEFLLAGFAGEQGLDVARSYYLAGPHFYPHMAEFPGQKFEVIGRSRHGALYSLHRFGNQEITIDQAAHLAGFTLGEIYECDTTVGGLPTVWVLRRGEKAEPIEPSEVENLMRWAGRTGKMFGRAILGT